MKTEIFNVLFFICGVCFGKKFTVKNATENPQLWDINCQYSPEVEDFWVWGTECSGVDSATPVDETLEGFYSGCGKPCSIIFDTGKFINPIEMVNISFYTDLNAEVFLYGMQDASDPNQNLIANYSNTFWTSRTLNFTENGNTYKVLNVTVVPSRNMIQGNIFIESIDIEASLIENAVVVLDTHVEQTDPEWITVNCLYGNSYEEFKAAGCSIPVHQIPHPNDGFYKPCNQSVCEFVYYSNLLTPAKALNLAYFIRGSGNSSIVISGKSKLKEKSYKEIATITSSEGIWTETKIVLEGENELFGRIIKIKAIQEGRTDMEFYMDQVIIDKITIDVDNGHSVTPYPGPVTGITEPQSTMPTVPTGAPSTGAPSTEAPSTTPDNSASIHIYPISSLLMFFIMITKSL